MTVLSIYQYLRLYIKYLEYQYLVIYLCVNPSVHPFRAYWYISRTSLVWRKTLQDVGMTTWQLVTSRGEDAKVCVYEIVLGFLHFWGKKTFIDSNSSFKLNTDNILISLAIPVSLYLVLQDHFVATPLLHSYVSLVIVRSSCSSQTVHSIMLASIYIGKRFVRVSYIIFRKLTIFIQVLKV